MKTKIVKVSYHSIENGAGIFASPSYTHNELVETENGLTDEMLINYIESKSDEYGNKFKKSKDTFMGFDYISNAGGVKVELYIPIKEKIIKL